MNEYDIILLTIGIAIFVFAIAFLLCMMRDADDLIHKADKMKDWAREELNRRAKDDGTD